MSSYIELKNIDFCYEGEDKKVFSDFSLSVNKGECLAIKGANGSGKSTLFKILNGLEFVSEGSYIFDEMHIDRNYMSNNVNSKLFHKRVGYLFQNPDIMLFNGQVYDEVAFGPRQMGLSDAEVDLRTRDMLKLFDIEALEKKAPYHLSGGQKKRVALAAVMALNPEVIVLDEPLAGLDSIGEAKLIDLLFELKKAGKTIIVATHSEAFSDKISDRELSLM